MIPCPEVMLTNSNSRPMIPRVGMLAVISVRPEVSLVSMFPSAVLLEDCGDMNSIELAILSNACSAIVSILQNISALEHMKKSGKLSEEYVERGLTRLKDLVSPFVLDWFKALIDA